MIDDIDILDGCRIDCYESNYFQIYMNIFGKIINLKMIFKDNEGNINRELNETYSVGILNSIKEFVEKIESKKNIKVNLVYINARQVNFKEDRSFSSLGTKENSDVIIYYFK